MIQNQRYINHVKDVYNYNIAHLSYENNPERLDRGKINTSLELVERLQNQVSRQSSKEPYEKMIPRLEEYRDRNVEEYELAVAGMIGNNTKLIEKLKKIGTPKGEDSELVSMIEDGINYLDDIKSYHETINYTANSIDENKQSMLDYNTAVELLTKELIYLASYIGLDAEAIGLIREDGINEEMIPKIKKTARYAIKTLA